ncbi:MAG: plasmid pRiA4b ORF-3 family protein [Thermoguttaceae bacterium]
MPTTKTSYLLKITLLDTKPPIWRRFVVPSNINLGELHYIIQSVMGWHDSHLHAFDIGNEYYGNTDDDLPEEKYTLEEVASSKGTTFKYQYDFGDSWDHKIVVENTDYTNPDFPYPIYCIKGAGACPPEDCGGVWGFYDFCEAMADPKHPEHRGLKSWFGGKYDPAEFSIDVINTRLGIKVSSAPRQKKIKKVAPTK